MKPKLRFSDHLWKILAVILFLQDCSLDQTTASLLNLQLEQPECYREGFFRHPQDCAHFYRCVDWSHEGNNFVVFSFVCPVGSVFDETVQVCNFPWLAPPCVPGGDFGGNDDYEDGEELIDHQEEGSSFIPVDSDGGIYPELPPLPPGGGFIPPPFPPPPGLPPPPSPFFPGGGPPPPHLPYPPSGLPPPPPGGLFDESNNTVIDENGSVVPISTLPPRPPRPPPGGGNVPISSLPPRPPFGGGGIPTPPSFGGSGGNNPSSGSISELPSFPGGFPGGNPGSNPGLGGAGGNGGNGGAVPISTLPPRPQGPPTGAPPFGSGGISNRPPSSGGGSFGGDTTMPPSSLLPPAGGSGGDSGFGTGDEDDRFDIDSIGGIPDNGIGGGGSFESTSGSDAVEISQNPPGTNNQFKVLPGSLYDCPAPGFYPYEDNCIEFYVCLEVLPGILNAEQLYRCPRNYLFDEDSRLCMKEEKVNCRKFMFNAINDFGKENVLVVLEQFLEPFFATPLTYNAVAAGVTR